MRLNTVVIDNGTGYTKMGYAGNQEPNFIIPTCVATKSNRNKVQVSRSTYDQLDFYVGDEAKKKATSYDLVWPLRSGEISDFDIMEKLWHRCIYSYLRCEPEEHVVMLTEPPMNPPSNRETIAEIMFETFNVAGLHIGVQAVLALYSSWFHSGPDSIQRKLGLTGTVVDSGDGVTHIIPMADGYVIGSCIKHIPLAGSDITEFIKKMIWDRGYKIDTQDMTDLAQAVKEEFSFVSKDPVQELLLWDKRIKKKNKLMYKQFKYKSILSGKEYEIDVGYEVFMGPEMFFRPEIVDPLWTRPLDQELDETILMCPVDLRRNLYNNIILSGGSCQTEGLKDRLFNHLRTRVDTRLAGYQKKSGRAPKPIDINISASPYDNFAVWNGGSMLAMADSFQKAYHTREKYQEYGPSIARYNPVFTEGAA